MPPLTAFMAGKGDGCCDEGVRSVERAVFWDRGLLGQLASVVWGVLTSRLEVDWERWWAVILDRVEPRSGLAGWKVRRRWRRLGKTMRAGSCGWAGWADWLGIAKGKCKASLCIVDRRRGDVMLWSDDKCGGFVAEGRAATVTV